MEKKLYLKAVWLVRLALIVFILSEPIQVLAQNKNYIQQELITIPGITSAAQVDNLNISQKQTSRTFLDGLGRKVQEIGVGASPAERDIIKPISYDITGGESVSYLPYAGVNAFGNFRAAALSEQAAFYQTSGQKIANDSAPFAQSAFENSPLHRVLQMGSVGDGFQPGQHYKSFEYTGNVNGETVRYWNGNGTPGGIYAQGSLSVSGVTDEQGGQTLVYTDRMGKTVLKKQLVDLASNTWTETGYAYSSSGMLTYVIPPKAMALMASTANFDLAQSGLSTMLFRYTYDHKGRAVEVTKPGSGTVYTIYDPLDRPVLVQDVNLRNASQWNYLKYDNRGNVISQGIYTDGAHIGRDVMQAYVNGFDYSVNYFEKRANISASGYYTNNVFPVSAIEPLAFSYYDDYDLDGNGSADYAYQNQGLSGESVAVDNTRGYQTMVRKRTVGEGLGDLWLTTVIFYDKNGRVIQSANNNALNVSVNSSRTSVLDFTGKTLRTKAVQVVASGTTVVQSEYNYDHTGRLKTVDQSFNGGPAIRIAGYEYNELGQLVDRKLHSSNAGASYLQSVDYRYTIGGQLSSINNSGLTIDDKNDDANDVFGMELLYNQVDAAIGNSPYFNGLISAVKWKANAPGISTGNERSYVFAYDKLLRLNSATYLDKANGGSWSASGAFDEKNISCDLNGNILSLQRNALLSGSVAAVDDLAYSYTGDRLSNITDGNGSSYSAFGFKNLTGSADAYLYSENGNLLSDPKKGLALSYNKLNRTERITITTATGRYIDYSYDAGGAMIRKQAFDQGSLVTTTDYIDGFVYENGNLSYFGMTEGRVRNASGVLTLEYMVKDQQGNVRVSFEDQAGVAVVRQENSYYPFGLSLPGSTIPGAANKNLYNGGSEWQNDFGDMPDLQQTFYRMYDAALGRFIASDPMAEASESFNAYHYALNNPVMFNDPLGDMVDVNGNPTLHVAGRIGIGSGNHWADGMGFSDWDAGGGGSDSYREALRQGGLDWGGSLVKYIDGMRRQLSSRDGMMGYWVPSASFGNGTTTYFNALTGKMEESVDVGGPKLTWKELGTYSSSKSNSNWATMVLGVIAADAVTPDPTDAAWPKWATEAVVGTVALGYQDLKNPFYYVTYTKTNTQGNVYVGRSSGYGNPISIVNARDVNHHIKGYGPAILSSYAPATIPGGYSVRYGDPSYWFIRGSEQLQIQYYRELGISGNAYNGISPNNGNKETYLNEIMKYLKL